MDTDGRGTQGSKDEKRGRGPRILVSSGQNGVYVQNGTGVRTLDVHPEPPESSPIRFNRIGGVRTGTTSRPYTRIDVYKVETLRTGVTEIFPGNIWVSLTFDLTLVSEDPRT